MKLFEEKYPYISAWVLDGQIEIGYGEYDDVFIRAIDAGGVAFESNAKFSSMDEAFAALEQGIADYCNQWGIDLDLDLRLGSF